MQAFFGGPFTTSCRGKHPCGSTQSWQRVSPTDCLSPPSLRPLPPASQHVPFLPQQKKTAIRRAGHPLLRRSASAVAAAGPPVPPSTAAGSDGVPRSARFSCSRGRRLLGAPAGRRCRRWARGGRFAFTPVAVCGGHKGGGGDARPAANAGAPTSGKAGRRVRRRRGRRGRRRVGHEPRGPGKRDAGGGGIFLGGEGGFGTR